MDGRDYTDEMLMAYADGELPAAQMVELDAAIAGDPALAERVGLFAETRELARASRLAPQAAVPDHLAASVQALVRAATAPQPAPLPERVLTAANSNTPSTWRRIAAAAALAAVAGMGGYIAGGLDRNAAPPLQIASDVGAELSAHLSTLASGDRGPLFAGAGHVEVIATFEVGDKVCREFEVAEASQSTTLAVACRSGDAWTTTFAMLRGGDPAGYLPASGTETVEAYLASIAAGPMFDESREQSFLTGLSK